MFDLIFIINMETITVIVETLKGSNAKFNYDEQNKRFRLKKLLPAGMVFPFDFGFIPDTTGGDGDALDVLVIAEFSMFTGCAVDCRIIGCITAEQKFQNKVYRNDRFLAVPEASKQFAAIKTLNDLPVNMIDEIESFFINYNTLENKIFKPLERLDAAQALQLIKSK